MKALSRLLRARNLRYALGEIGLIFVGITLALIANARYENLKSREEEGEILTQLIVSLQTDIQALRDKRAEYDRKSGSPRSPG